MIDFVFQNPTKIYFGKSALSNLKSEAAHWGERVLLVYGGGSIKRTGVYDQVMAQLAGTQVWELGGVQPNPRLSLVREGIRLCHEHDIQLVLAVGGGSAIDTAKAVANGACYDGDVWDLFDGKGRNTEVLPLGTVVTIPAAGSEMSDSCVITPRGGPVQARAQHAAELPQVLHSQPRIHLYVAALPDGLRRGGHHGAHDGALFHPASRMWS